MAANQKLTEKQRKFAQEYLKSGNATESAKLAGYSEKSAHVQGHDCLKNPKVIEYIERHRRKQEAIADVTQAQVLQRLWEIAQQDDDLRSAVGALTTLARCLKMMSDKFEVDINMIEQRIVVVPRRLTHEEFIETGPN